MSQKSQKRIAVDRIPVSPRAHDKLHSFKSGLKTSFSEAIEILLALAVEKGEDEFHAGERLKQEFSKDE